MTKQRIYLTDDGTLDTVLRCEDCGEEMRYTFDAEWHDSDCRDDRDCGCYDTFVEWAIDDADGDHECKAQA